MTAEPANRKAAEFSILSTAAAISAWAWFYLPVISIFAGLVIPVFFAMLVRRLDIKFGLAALLLMAAAAFAATGKLQAVFMIVLQTGPLGLLLGLLFKNHISPGKSTVLTVALSLAVSLVMMLAGYFFTGKSPLTLSESQRHLFDQERRLLNDMFGPGGTAGEVDPATLKELEKVVSQVEAMWPVIYISSVMIWFMVSAVITLWLTRLAMHRSGHAVPPAIPFSRWRVPWYVIWGIISGLALMLAGDHTGAAGLAVFGKSFLWVTGFCLSVAGLSVFIFYVKRWKVAWPIKVMAFVVMGIYLPLTAGMLVAMGIADSVWNIRRLDPDGRTPEEVEKK